MITAEFVGPEYTITHRKSPSLPPHHSAPHLAACPILGAGWYICGWKSKEDESLTPPTSWIQRLREREWEIGGDCNGCSQNEMGEAVDGMRRRWERKGCQTKTVVCTSRDQLLDERGVWSNKETMVYSSGCDTCALNGPVQCVINIVHVMHRCCVCT